MHSLVGVHMVSYLYCFIGCSEEGVGLFSQCQDKKKCPQDVPRGGSRWALEEFLHGKDC